MTPALLPFLLESTLFAAVATLLARYLDRRSASTRHAILLAAIAKFTLPLSWFFVLGITLRSLLPSSARSLPIASLLTGAPSAAAQPLTNHAGRFTTIALAVALTLWIAGALLFLALWLRRLRIPTHAPASTSASDLATLARLSRRIGLRQTPRLCLSAAESPPFLAGLVRPSIHIPHDLSRQLTPPEFEAVLLHELAHCKRWDNLTRAYVHAVTCFFWFHPLLWWLERRIERETELACDDLVLSSGIPSEVYLQGICKVCELSLLQPIPGRSHLSGPILKHRLERIMSLSSTRPRTPFAANLLGPLLLTGALALATVAGIVTSTPIHAQIPDAAAISPTNCIWASKPFPQGTAVRPTHHPELLQVCGNEDGRPRWFKTTEAQVSTRDTPVVAVDDTPDPQTISCKVTAPEINFCTCDHHRFSPGSVVGSPVGRLVCPASTGEWQHVTGGQTPYPPLPANPVPLQQ